MPAISMLSVWQPPLPTPLCHQPPATSHLPRHFLCSHHVAVAVVVAAPLHTQLPLTRSLNHPTSHSFTSSFTYNSIRSLCFMIFTVAYMFCCCFYVSMFFFIIFLFIVMRSCFLFTFDFQFIAFVWYIVLFMKVIAV